MIGRLRSRHNKDGSTETTSVTMMLLSSFNKGEGHLAIVRIVPLQSNSPKVEQLAPTVSYHLQAASPKDKSRPRRHARRPRGVTMRQGPLPCTEEGHPPLSLQTIRNSQQVAYFGNKREPIHSRKSSTNKYTSKHAPLWKHCIDPNHIHNLAGVDRRHCSSLRRRSEAVLFMINLGVCFK